MGEATSVTVSTADGTAKVSDSDYAARTGFVVNFAANQTTATFTVSPTADSKVEADETFSVALGTVTGGHGSLTASATPRTGTITNDDSATLTIAPASVTEGGDLVFTVTLSAAVQGGVKVDYATGDVSANAGVDYTATSGTLTFSGTANETQTFTAHTTDDNKVEANETLTATLGNVAPQGDGVGAANFSTPDSPATGTIVDNDSTTASVTALSADKSEGNSGTQAFTFTVSLSNPSDFTTTVKLNTADGTATAGEDYAAVVDQLVSFAPGETSKTVTVTVNGDTKVEGDETFTANLSAVTGTRATIATGSATGTIQNDDSAIFSIRQNESGLENGGPITFTIDLSNPVGEATSVTVSTADGTAKVSDSDYAALDGFVVNFAANQTTATFTVSPTADTKVEADETFSVALGTVTGGHGSLTASATLRTGTITNDDSAIFSIRQNESGLENGGPITFTIDLSNSVDEATSVTVSTTDGTAKVSDSDYAARTSFVVNFAANQTTATFTVSPTADTKVEGGRDVQRGPGHGDRRAWEPDRLGHPAHRHDHQRRLGHLQYPSERERSGERRTHHVHH